VVHRGDAEKPGAQPLNVEVKFAIKKYLEHLEHVGSSNQNARSLKPTSRAEENARYVDGFRDDDLFLGLREKAIKTAVAAP
jgi:hypothetical protein